MRLHLCAVGRLKAGPEAELLARYAQGLKGLGQQIGLGELALVEIDDRKGPKGPAGRDWQARQLLERLPANARKIVLDASGRALSSDQLAGLLGGWRDGGVGDAALLIGGADGHGQAALAAADIVLCLGPMTWPHLLARVMVAEQLYRAAAILARHPYHHG